MPPPPEAREAEIRYSVVVANQPVRDVLLAMARETKVNFDIHPGVEGTINLNAIDQTLKQILTRIARQVDMRWETDGQTITVMPDSPYLRNYQVDYVNMSRDVSGSIGVQSQVVTPRHLHQQRGHDDFEPLRARTTRCSRSTMSRRTASGRRSRRTSRTCCARPTSFCPRAAARRWCRRAARPPAPRGRRCAAAARPRPRAPTGGAASVTTTRRRTHASQQTQEFAEQRLTFREAASVIVNPESGVVIGARHLAPAREGGRIPRAA